MKSSIKNFIRNLLAWCTKGRETLPVLAGPIKGFRVPREIALSNLYLLFGKYEATVTQAIFSIAKPIAIAYDIGAHIGLMSLVLARRVGRDGQVFAFEPSHENATTLDLLVAVNTLGRNVSQVSAAVAERNGEQKLYKWGASSMCVLDAATTDLCVKGCNYDLVRTLTLDSFVFENANPPPDLIKIDVEGAEGLVLRGAQRVIGTYHPVLILELHGPKNASDVWEILQRYSYRWHYLSPSTPYGARDRQSEIGDKSRLLSYFGKGDAWTQHVLLV